MSESPSAKTQEIRRQLLNSLEWRCIGPHRGGRVVAVAGDVSDPMTFYFGACAGGVWKTTDGGQYWRNVSDGFFNTAAVEGFGGFGIGSQCDLCRNRRDFDSRQCVARGRHL